MACAEALQAHAHAIPNSKTNRPLFQIPFSCAFCISSCIVCIPICWAIGNISAVALGFISDNFFPTGVS